MPKITALRQTERRDRILDAAERCFARSGFRGATMAEICADAHVSAGGAYLYFRSKEDLIAGIAERDRERIAIDCMQLADVADFLGEFDRLARHYLFDEPPHRRLLMLEIAAEAGRNPIVAEQWRRVDRVIRDSFEKALATQIEIGRLRPRYDVQTLATLIIVIGDGMMQRIALDPDFDHASAVPAMMGMIRQLLGVDDAPVRGETNTCPTGANKTPASGANAAPAALDAAQTN